MNRTAYLIAAILLLAGCASTPELTPWRADPLLAGLPPACTTGASAPEPAELAEKILPGGLGVVRSQGRDTLIVAARGCAMTVDVVTGAAEPLPTRGDSIAPTMLDVTGEGVAFSSSLSGSVRAINPTGAVTFNVSSLREPLGLRLLPGGAVLTTEFGTGRILHLGPNEDSRVRLIADALDGPVGLAVVDATKGYVTEYHAGRVTQFRLDRFEKTIVTSHLNHPEGIALMGDGRLAVVEVGLRRLIAIEPITGKFEVLAADLPIGLVSPAGDRDPYTVSDVAAGPDGALYVSADIGRTILKVTLRPPPKK